MQIFDVVIFFELRTIQQNSSVVLYVAWKRLLHRKFARFVLFRIIKKRSFNLLCVLDLSCGVIKHQVSSINTVLLHRLGLLKQVVLSTFAHILRSPCSSLNIREHCIHRYWQCVQLHTQNLTQFWMNPLVYERNEREKKRRQIVSCSILLWHIWCVCVFVCVPGLFSQEEKPELIDTIPTSAKNLIMFSLVFTWDLCSLYVCIFMLVLMALINFHGFNNEKLVCCSHSFQLVHWIQCAAFLAHWS